MLSYLYMCITLYNLDCTCVHVCGCGKRYDFDCFTLCFVFVYVTL